MIFQLYRDVGVPLWHCDVLLTPIGIVDIGLIKDETNVAAPRRGPRVDLQPLSENLADTVEQAQGADPATLEPTDTTLAESAPSTSRAPSYFRSTPPSATLVPIARVQKQEAQIATLLHHILPWMKKSIAEAENRM